MRHTFLAVTVKRRSKSVYIYGSYRKIKTEVPLFWTTLLMYRGDDKVAGEEAGDKMTSVVDNSYNVT